MDDQYSIGTILFNNELQKIGTIIDTWPTLIQTNNMMHYYEVDTDPFNLWPHDKVKVISNKKEFLYFKIKYG